MSDAAISFVVLGVLVALFLWNVFPVEIVALGGALALYAAGVLDLSQTLAGFGDPTVIFVGSLFVVSEGLDATGVTTWAGQRLGAGAGAGDGPSVRRVTIRTLLLVAVLAALISVTGAVAALVPMVAIMAIRAARPASAMLMPVAFAASAGSMLALTGSPVNVIVSEAAADAGVGSFGYLEFALVGVPLVAGTLLISVLFGSRLLPARTPRTLPADLSRHARALVEHYALADGPDTRQEAEQRLFTRDTGVAEVVVPPRSEVIGERLFPGMRTESGDFVVLAVRRRDPEAGEDAVIAEGDVLLLQGDWRDLDERLPGADVLVVDAPGAVRRQTVPFGRGTRTASAILGVMVVVLAAGVMPAVVASLLAAVAMVLLGVLTPDQAYRAVSWPTLVLVAAMIAVSTAIAQSGAAARIADVLVDAVGGGGPRLLLVALFLLTAVLGQLISNTATALIVIPVAVSAAADLDVSARPVLMSVCVAAAASFLTPVATPANLMVMGPGGYRFGDYWRLGLPLLAFFGVVATLLVPVIWSF